MIAQLEKANPGVGPSEAVAEYDDFYTLVETYCLQASEYVSAVVNRVFVPYRHEYQIYASDAWIRNRVAFRELALPDDLLLEVAVKRDGVVLAPSAYRPVSLSSYTQPPFYAIRFHTVIWDDEVLSIDGWWGYSRGVNQTYRAVAVEPGTLSAGATTMPVTSGAAYEAFGAIWIVTGKRIA